MKRYPAYKDSGIEWSPQIPENWQARPVKTWFDVQLGKMLQNDSESPLEKKVPYLKALHVTWGQVQTEDLPEMWASQTQIIQYGVKNGDLLVCEGGEVGRSGIVTNPPVDCIIQNALHRVRARNNAHISYLMHVLFAMGGADWFSILCNKATIAHFTREKFVGSKIPLPSFDEQTIISSYLDRKTKEIDNLIAKKERMIELLKEERTAIINQAVTKGLNPKVEMKNSDIEWLGNIPKHWLLKKIKYITRVNTRALSETTKDDYDFHYVDIGNVDLEDGFILGEKIKFINAPSRARRIVAKGDTIVSTVRTYLKAIAYFEDNVRDVIVSTGFAVIHPLVIIHPRYLYYVLRSEIFIDRVCAISVGVSYPATNASDLASLPAWFPPDLKEQEEIVEYLDQIVAKTRTTIHMLQREIELLKEYRTALISEVVTGKIDLSADRQA